MCVLAGKLIDHLSSHIPPEGGRAINSRKVAIMGCSLKLGNRAGGMNVTEEPMAVGLERSRVIVSGFRPSLPRMPVMEVTGIETS
jgi:hypothetical protein